MAFCIAKTKANKDCTAQAMQGVSYCYRHNPDIPEADKIEASVAGGRRRAVLTNASPVTLRNVESIVSLIESNINGVRTGELDPKVSNAVVQNLGILLKVYELAIVDSRVRKLEEKAGIESPDELMYMGGK
jgi:hypothetical protein